tara:strand:- start:192 stop:950 length:759 start_codon:yes stop_codon:yes gene_type:complete
MVKMSKNLHLCVVMSDSYFPIYQNIFNRTLPREFDSVNILHIRDHDSLPGFVGEYNFKMINFKRLQFVAEKLFAYQGDNLLVLDIDAVFFRNFKDEINKLLETKDMVFQHNPHYEHQPYCIATWGLQCSEKNINFFAEEVLPRSSALLKSSEEWEELVEKKVPLPDFYFSHRTGKQQHYDGDACVINTAILESDLGKELKVELLPDTYTQEFDGGPNVKNCVLYQSAGEARGTEEKANALVRAYENIKRKIL